MHLTNSGLIEKLIVAHKALLTVASKLPKGNSDWLISCRFKQDQFSNTAYYYIYIYIYSKPWCTKTTNLGFLSVFASRLLACLTPVTKPFTDVHRDRHSSLQPSLRPCILCTKTTGVYDPSGQQRHPNSYCCVCVYFLGV